MSQSQALKSGGLFAFNLFPTLKNFAMTKPNPQTCCPSNQAGQTNSATANTQSVVNVSGSSCSSSSSGLPINNFVSSLRQMLSCFGFNQQQFCSSSAAVLPPIIQKNNDETGNELNKCRLPTVRHLFPNFGLGAAVRLPSLHLPNTTDLPPIRIRNIDQPICLNLPSFAQVTGRGDDFTFQRPRSIQTINQQQEQPQEQLQRQPQQRQRQRRGRPANRQQNQQQQPAGVKVLRKQLNRVQQHNCQQRTRICQYCNAKLFPKERPGMCCTEGKIILPEQEQYPEELRELLTGNNVRSRRFRQNIRSYNSALAFTSAGVKLDERLTPNGIYTYRIHGQVYHRIGSLIPEQGQIPKFSQLYVYDTNHELENRMAVMGGLDPEILEVLQRNLHQSNPFVEQFRQAVARIDRNQNENLTFVIRENCGNDRRRYNRPTASEIAGFVPGDLAAGENIGNRDIVLSKQDGNLKRISELNCGYDPLRYVLLFPTGQTGWHIGMYSLAELPEGDEPKRVTAAEYYRYMIMERTNFSGLFYAGRLFHEYLVDMYCKVESQRLRWIQKNQGTIRADLYRGLVDALLNDRLNAAEIGRRVILPSSFTGGPRYMHQRCQDALTVAAKRGKPTYMITMTCNPNWPEIKEECRQRGIQPQDDPVLINRVFYLKMTQLLADLKSGLFGKVVACIHVVEFQKRGLPHVHILLTVDETYLPHTTELIDQIVCAEIPDKEIHPRLYEIVTKNMIHGPCGAAKPNSPCMRDGACSKKFPKAFQPATEVHQDGYPLYQRRDNGVFVEKDGIQLDNRWTVPYNPYLLLKYDCHINVEVCTNVTSIKYIFKYVHKGNDMATVEIARAEAAQNNNNGQQNNGQQDEVKQFLEGRYISATEAAWRLLELPMYGIYPSVQRLAVHLPNEQHVTFRANQTNEEILQAANKDTTLTAWFRLNRTNRNAHQLTYDQVPSHFTWDKKALRWKRRKMGKRVGRMVFLSPAQGEVYYLRLLLTQLRGCRSFEEMRTFNGVTYETFKETCIARGLLRDDAEYMACLDEAIEYRMPAQIRQLFTMILLFCEPTQPVDLWNRYKDSMTEDFLYRQPQDARNIDSAYNEALIDIENYLNRNGKCLRHYPGMPVPDRNNDQRGNRLIAEQMSYNREVLRERLQGKLETMNEDQRNFYEAVMDKVGRLDDGGDDNVFFLDGPGGTGKTFLWSAILDSVRSQGKIALAVASSGVAAGLLEGGRTAHSLFKIPVQGLTESSSCSIAVNTQLAQLIREAAIIIWDECSMIHKHAVMAVERTVSDIMSSSNPELSGKIFGGKIISFGGDFRQVLPVIPKASRAQNVSAVINRVYFWDKVRAFQLKQNMRVQNTANQENRRELQEFADWLLEIGNGNMENLEFPEHMRQGSIDNLMNEIFPCGILNNQQEKIPINRAILASVNTEVEEINNKIVNRMEGEEFVYLSRDALIDEDNNARNNQNYPTEFLNAQSPSGCPQHRLVLKNGCPVILLRNLDVSRGLCNGTRLWIRRCNNRVLEAEVATGTHAGDIVFIPRIPIHASDPNLPFRFSRVQFPVRLAFAMSINKAQGQTLDKVGLYLQRPVFSHGQLYVALSRATRPNGLHVFSEANQSPNVVYKEVFNQ